MSELPHERLFGDYGDWPGRDVLDSGGDRLGGVREIYLDRETGRPEWVLVEVEGDQPRFVPLADASVESSAIRVAHPASVVHNAPTIGPEAHIDNDQERRLYEHYGIAYSEDASDSGLPADVALPDSPAGVEDAPPEDTATAETAAAGAGPTAGDDADAPTEALWSEVDTPAEGAPAGAAPGEVTPGLPPSGPPEAPAFAGEEPATPGLPEPADAGAALVTPGAPESGAPALPEPPAEAVADEREPVPQPPPAAAPPPPPAPDGASRRLPLAGGAAALAVLLFILVRRLRS